MMMKPFNYSRNLSLSLIFVLACASCGKSSSGGGMGIQENLSRTQEGKYRIDFHPLNPSLAGMTDANGLMQVKGDQFSLAIEVRSAPALSMHAQQMYFSDFCPDESHDTNFDGNLDQLELSMALGKVLLPLDDDLSSQQAGAEVSPVSDYLGQYKYEKEASLLKILTDLYGPDLDPKDQLRKLQSTDNFTLEGKVIVLFGVSEETYLPGSIRSLGVSSDRASLPIACGKVIRLPIN